MLKVQTVDSKGNQKPGIFKVPVMVGNTPYNILLTLALGKLGWKTVLTDGVSIDHAKNGWTLTDTMIWCETPWLKVQPHFRNEIPLQSCVTGSEVETGQLCGIDRKQLDELEVHRSKGHTPFHPQCEHCLKAKGVKQHRRRNENKVETEIQADFLYSIVYFYGWSTCRGV